MDVKLSPDKMLLGGNLTDGDTAEFLVWAPFAKRVHLELISPTERMVRMKPLERGYHGLVMDDVGAGARYFYRLNSRQRRADPASKSQPDGIYGPSEVVNLRHEWTDQAWRGLALDEYIIYELHVGSFTRRGDFRGVERRLDTLQELGVTAIELMPVAQFPGRRNWGYDGVFPFAAQNSYGGPQHLQRLVDACHKREIAVVLDVVYNHLGPEGNYFGDFGPYFTDRYHTPWGKAINFDGSGADEVRRFVIDNALHWIRNFHIDALRLDAIQTIFDNSPRPILSELSESLHEEAKRLGRLVHVIGETNQNDVRQITEREQGGLGLDAVWSDDFHHSQHALLTGERMSVFVDFGRVEDLAKAYADGFVLAGQYSQRHGRHHGSDSSSVPGERFVICSQNHDQVGNRLYGERLSQLVSFRQAKMAAALLLLAPNVPMLFMGEEYGETAPFLYFVDHHDERLLDRVRKGRLRDCAAFVRPGHPVPDATSEATFLQSRLNPSLRRDGDYHGLWQLYSELIRLRKTNRSLSRLEKSNHAVHTSTKPPFMISRRWNGDHSTVALFHFGDAESELSIALPPGQWTRRLDTEDKQFAGPGAVTPFQMPSDGQAKLVIGAQNAVVFELDAS